MLPKRRRLHAHEVRDILAEGRSVRGTHLSMKFISTTNSFKAAAVVPKSLVRKATARNRLRRALYRALGGSSFSAKKISAVFFVRVIPSGALTPAFAGDLAAFASKI